VESRERLHGEWINETGKGCGYCLDREGIPVSFRLPDTFVRSGFFLVKIQNRI
jgi:hypothetical protein